MAKKNDPSQIDECIENTTPSARELFLKKPYGNIHPKAVADYIPIHPVRMPKLRNEDAYGYLTDESTYSQYAWEFVRRNRFYQRFIDEGSHKFRFADWGYLSSVESAPSFGLARAKPYRESFRVGKYVTWIGIHTFQERLKQARPRRQGMLDIEQPKSQVAIIFDIEALFGDNTTAALENQVSMATLHLNALAEEAGIQRPATKPTKDNGTKKKQLRAQLFVADLLSTRATISEEPEPVTKPPAHIGGDDFDDDSDPMQITDIAGMAPDYLFNITSAETNRVAAPLDLETIIGNSDSKKQRVGRISELARDAWSNIYNWQMLKLLQHDDWSHLVPRRPKNRLAATD